MEKFASELLEMEVESISTDFVEFNTPLRERERERNLVEIENLRRNSKKSKFIKTREKNAKLQSKLFKTNVVDY